MKELSIEEKAKRYDEAIKKAAALYKAAEPMSGCNVIIETIFPELKENEDERMLREIKRYIKEQGDKPTGLPNGTAAVADMIAWLEKQSEKPNNVYDKELSEILGCVIRRYINDPNISYTEREKVSREIIPYVERLEKQGEPTDINPSEFDLRLNKLLKRFETLPKEALVSSLSFYLNVVQNDGTYKPDEKQGEQKPAEKIESKFKVGDYIASTISGIPYYITQVAYDHYITDVGCVIMFNAQNNFELAEKPTKWSEEDERIKDITISFLEEAKGRGFETAVECIDWLKNRLKSLRPQNWTKEDKERYISCLQRLGTGNPEQPETINSKWFKEHVYHQSTWKPSDEQMEALNTINVTGCITDIGQGRLLVELYQDLKKLRKE